MAPLILNEKPDAGDFPNERVAWDVLKAVGAKNEPDCIDMSRVKRLRPYALACLAGISLRSSKSIQVIPPVDQECYNHLCRLGFFAMMGHQQPALRTRDTNVPIRQLTDWPGQFHIEAAEVWAGQIENGYAGFVSDIAENLCEVIMNALTHAESRIGCVVAGQAFPKAGSVEVSVLDLGQTIRGHLRKHPKYSSLNDDEEAIELATHDAVTGTVGLNRWNEPNSGAGLTILRRFCEDKGLGEMTIVSGDNWISYGPKGRKVVKLWPRFGGCLVNIRFFTKLPLTTAEEDEYDF